MGALVLWFQFIFFAIISLNFRGAWAWHQMLTSFNLANVKMGLFPTGAIRNVPLHSPAAVSGSGRAVAPCCQPPRSPPAGVTAAETSHTRHTGVTGPSSPSLPAAQRCRELPMVPAGKEQPEGLDAGGDLQGGKGWSRSPRDTPTAAAEIPSPAVTPLCPDKGLLHLRVCV